MSDEKKFSFQPDSIGKDADGTHKVDNANSYVMLQSQTQGVLFYTPLTNKYWIAPEKECPKELFEKKFLPYLRWGFDEVQTSEDGQKINLFPATPENIAIKRKELLEEAMKSGDVIDQKKINSLTSPTTLSNNEVFESKLDKSNSDDKLIRRLNSMSRY